ncbi:MAG TPA: O-antigen ligase family protein [Solirubrobacteraceae bacterium]|nr:O-antigen ligase family protein [Solirubrobacteraceae bacterium]
MPTAAHTRRHQEIGRTSGPRGIALAQSLGFRGALLVVLGIGAGISPVFSGYYNTGVWTPIGLGVVVVSAAALVARPPRLGRLALIALVALAGLGLWSLLSLLWTPTSEQAILDANRWLVYAATLLLALTLIRSRRHVLGLLAAAGAGLAITAAIVVVRLLGHGGPLMFVAGRLNLPLGYVNGEGCAFAMSCWLALALAERRHPVAAGAGAFATVMLAGLTLLSQSRGAAIALFITLFVVVAALPGRRRRLLAVATVAVAVAAAATKLLNVYSDTGASGAPPPHVLHTAMAGLLLAAMGAGVIWGLLALAARAAAPGSSGRDRPVQRTLQRLATAAAILVVVLPVGAALFKAGSIERTVSNQWHAFVNLSGAAGSGPGKTRTHLLSGAGNRYDYWRVAWHLFTAHPVAGVGAGGYTVGYYQQRRTTEAIENPHSIELELLSELGIVGGALLLALAVACVFGARRLAAAARTDAAARTAVVAAAGVALTWLVDTSGDWMHLLPGVTAIALAAIAVLCYDAEPAAATVAAGSPPAIPAPATTETGPTISVPKMAVAALVGFVLALAGASLMRTGLAQIYLDNAEGALAHDPASALTNANRALRFDAANLESYYVKAAALARYDRAAAARAVLLQAAREQPTSFVTWTLLGDLEVRAGDVALARRYYGEAHRLDPNDPALAALVANPDSALNR